MISIILIISICSRGEEIAEKEKAQAEKEAEEQARLTVEKLSSAREKEIQDFLQKGEECYMKGEFESAATWFKKILAEVPEHKLAQKYIKKTKAVIELVEEEKVRREKEKERKTLAEKKKQHRKASRVEARKSRLAGVHLERGEKYYRAQKLKLAIKEWEKVLSIQPNNTFAEIRILKAKQKLEKKETAVENEERAFILIGEGKIHFRDGNYRQAVEAWQRVLTLLPANHPDYDRSESYIHAAGIYLTRLEKKEAVSRKDISERSAIAGVTELWSRREGRKREIEKREIGEEEAPEIKTKLEERAKQIVSVHFENAHIRSVLRYLSEVSGVNIVLDEAVFPAEGVILGGRVSPRVTIDLENLPLMEALTVILRAKNLAYRLEENVIWITTAARMAKERLVTKVYTLLTAITRVVQVKIPETEEEGEEEEEGARRLGFEEEGEGETETLSVETVVDTLKSAIPFTAVGSFIRFDRRTGTLIVRNTPTNLRVLEEIIRQIETVPMQVSIEAKFISIGTRDLRQLGIEYPYLKVGLGSKGRIDVGRDETYGIDLGYVSGVGEFTAGRGFALSYTKLNPTEFRMLLDAIEKTGSTNLLSAPKVMTRNQQEAVMKVVKEYRFPEDDSFEPFYYTYFYGGYRCQGRAIIPTSFAEVTDIGIMLTVLPDIGADMKTVTLKIHPIVNEFLGWITYGEISEDLEEEKVNIFHLQNIHEQEIDTQIVVEDGETVVLGGLIREGSSDIIKKVPFLGDIPLLGRLFKRTVTTNYKNSLLIFITTHLIKPTGERYRR